MRISVDVNYEDVLIFYTKNDTIDFEELEHFYLVCKEFINIGEGK